MGSSEEIRLRTTHLKTSVSETANESKKSDENYSDFTPLADSHVNRDRVAEHARGRGPLTEGGLWAD